MRKVIFSVMALGVMAFAGKEALAHSKFVQSTIWVYLQGPGDTTQNPNCEATTDDPCARLHHFDGTEVGEPVLDPVTGEEIIREGERQL